MGKVSTHTCPFKPSGVRSETSRVPGGELKARRINCSLENDYVVADVVVLGWQGRGEGARWVRGGVRTG